jgi:spiro-SPASM protein
MGSEQQWAHVLARLDHLIEKIPKSQIYIQTPRIQELDSEIEEYHQFAKKKGIQTIIQKYNRYIDLMPEKRVSDLTPIERNFCWHLVRDMQIQFDGQVTFCKQSQSSIGNLNQKSLIEIFQSQMIHSFNQYQNHLQDIPVSCANCDEWYTFNG